MELGTIFLLCFFVGLFFALGSAILGGLFGGHFGDGGGADVHADFSGADAHGDFHVGPAEAIDSGHLPHTGGEIHFSPFSPTVLATFVTSFGGVGYLLHEVQGYGAPVSVFGAAAVGLLVAGGIFAMLAKFFAKAQTTSEVRVAELVGASAEVIVGIPEKGLGEIAYTAMGGRFTSPAASATGFAIPRNTAVRIARIVGGTFHVEPAPARTPEEGNR